MKPVAALVIGALLGISFTGPALARDDLFEDQSFAGIAHDRRASAIGDVVGVLIYQSAEARNSARNTRSRRSDGEGRLRLPDQSESLGLSLGGEFTGSGEVRRSETFVTQISARVVQVLPNQDLIIEGRHTLLVNGEETIIEIRGRVRPIDISPSNQIVSTQIADAEIRYDGEGFVTRSASPGWLHGLFNRLGLN